MADDLRQVLDYIVRRYVVDDELRTIDRDAPTMAADLEQDKYQAARREVERADSLSAAFEKGVVKAWQRYAIGGTELPLDDRKPDENRMADALIRFLVSYDLASSRSIETGDRTYTYFVAIDWPKLRDIAMAAGVNLDRILGTQTPSR
ncbi:MAG: hypothetical protein QM589_02095 [Thermomicrobiales bacterium]